MLRRLIGEDIDLVWRPGTSLRRVRMDPSQLGQVLTNLCVNARDAIAGVGTVAIETSSVRFDRRYCSEHPGFRPGEFLMLAVSDDGSGMDAETRAHLFEPFYTTKGVGRGTGLGLAMVYGIVKQNDGLINVYSEPGAGTTIRIYLPASSGAETGRSDAPAEAVPLGRGEAVLVVEDEPAVRLLAVTMLQKLGYVAEEAATPEEALRMVRARAGGVRLLITDVVMPGMNGRELADRLRSEHPELKTLFMSGYTADVIAHRGILEQGVHFLQKPFSIKDLAERVHAALGGD
jgi:CheY-like chemotaxis protein